MSQMFVQFVKAFVGMESGFSTSRTRILQKPDSDSAVKYVNPDSNCQDSKTRVDINKSSTKFSCLV